MFSHDVMAAILVSQNKETGHYRRISDRGFDVLTERNRGQYIKVEVWDSPVMTERKRLISYL